MITIPQEIQDYFRSLPTDNSNGVELTKWGEDIWFTDHGVPEHTDPTNMGYNTVLCVLVNDGYRRVYLEDYGKIFAFPGYEIRFDGTKNHALMGSKDGDPQARFAAIIWDVPIDKSNKDIAKEMQERLDQLLTEVKQLQSQTIAVKQL